VPECRRASSLSTAKILLLPLLAADIEPLHGAAHAREQFVHSERNSQRRKRVSVCAGAQCRTLVFGLNPRCLINQTRAALAGEIAPEPLVLHAASILQLRQEHDVNERPDEPRNNSCEPDSA
jgi:hypothetical protein